MRIVFPFTFKRKNLLEYSKRHGILTKCSWGLFFPFTFKRNNLVEYSKRLVRRLSSGTDGAEQVCPSCAPRFFHRLGVSNSGRLPNNLDYPGRQLQFLMIMAEVVLLILYLFYASAFAFLGKQEASLFGVGVPQVNILPSAIPSDLRTREWEILCYPCAI